MLYDAVSYLPTRPFRPETSGAEFETDAYSVDLDGKIVLHLKAGYLDELLGNSPSEQRQIRKWHFYTAHFNCLYLLLDSIVARELGIAYFNLEAITTQNADVISSPDSVTISDRSPRRTQFLTSSTNPLVVPNHILQSVNRAFASATSVFERVDVLSELAKSLASYKSGDFTTSLVLSWFLLERFIESMWARNLEELKGEFENGLKRFNSDRRKSLEDHRSYPISVKLQILELNRRITFGQFTELDLLRGKRNDIVHPRKRKVRDEMAKNESDICTRAFQLLEHFLETDFDIQLALGKSYSHLGVYDRQ